MMFNSTDDIFFISFSPFQSGLFIFISVFCVCCILFCSNIELSTSFKTFIHSMAPFVRCSVYIHIFLIFRSFCSIQFSSIRILDYNWKTFNVMSDCEKKISFNTIYHYLLINSYQKTKKKRPVYSIEVNNPVSRNRFRIGSSLWNLEIILFYHFLSFCLLFLIIKTNARIQHCGLYCSIHG